MGKNTLPLIEKDDDILAQHEQFAKSSLKKFRAHLSPNIAHTEPFINEIYKEKYRLKSDAIFQVLNNSPSDCIQDYNLLRDTYFFKELELGDPAGISKVTPSCILLDFLELEKNNLLPFYFVVIKREAFPYNHSYNHLYQHLIFLGKNIYDTILPFIENKMPFENLKSTLLDVSANNEFIFIDAYRNIVRKSKLLAEDFIFYKNCALFSITQDNATLKKRWASKIKYTLAALFEKHKLAIMNTYKNILNNVY